MDSARNAFIRRLKVRLISRSNDNGTTGLSRYDRALGRALTILGEVELEFAAPAEMRLPGASLLRSATGLDVATFFRSYPLAPVVNGVDIVHLTRQTYSSVLWAVPPVPVVVTVHDLIPYRYRHDPRLTTYAHLVHRLFDVWSLRLLRRADAVLASSSATGADLLEQFGIQPSRLHVIPLGIEPAFSPQPVPPEFWHRFALDPSAEYGLHVSSEEPHKNLDTLLRAWRKVIDRCPGATLLKVGAAHDPRQRAYVRSLAHQLGLGERFRIIDTVSDQDLVHFYNAAAVFAFPSLAEGFGFPALEGMACGTPVVCSSIGVLHELVGDAAIRVPAKNTEALADALCEVLTDERTRARMTQRGLARAALFSWDRTARATYNAYTEVLMQWRR